MVDLSIVIPFYNEEKSIEPLYHEILNVLVKLEKSFEIIFIDDGSTDTSYDIVYSLQQRDPRISLIRFQSNRGKAAAINAGFKRAAGSIVFTMDADLQDDPKEIPRFLEKMDEGYDLVSGWKQRRFDPMEKKIPSKIFNFITSMVTGIKLHDFNCGFKAYRRDVIEEVKVYGDLHRYIPALTYWKGYRVGEISVEHHPRTFGESKYGWKRYFHGFFDLFTVVLITRFIHRPIYLFGLSGMLMLFYGLAILCFIAILQIIYGSILGHKPLSYFGVLSVLFGSQLIATGLVAEMLSVFRPSNDRIFSIREMISPKKEKWEAEVSIVIPVLNAAAYLDHFIREIEEGLLKFGKPCEVIFVDDGSDDDTFDKLKKFQFKDGVAATRVIRLRKSFGQSLAFQAGLDFTTGKYIIALDSWQPKPARNIKQFIDELENGAEIAIGRRFDMSFPRSFLSGMFNRFVARITRIPFHDLNSGVFAFRKEILGYSWYGARQRFYPLAAAKHGYRFVEIKVEYFECRQRGLKEKLKFVFSDWLDIITMLLMTDFKNRPLHMFGIVGFAAALVGFLINLYLTILKLKTGTMGHHYTLLLIGVMLMVMGLQWFSIGLLGEMINRFKQTDTNN